MGLATVVALAGCTGTGAEPAPTPVSTTAHDVPTPTPAPKDAAPTLMREGSATDNLPFFSAIVAQVWATEQKTQGRAYVDALVAAGFDKAAMQVTQDRSTVDNPAEALQFSVLWRGECLVGQAGPDMSAPVATVLQAVQGGTVCLIGETRVIDW